MPESWSRHCAPDRPRFPRIRRIPFRCAKIATSPVDDIGVLMFKYDLQGCETSLERLYNEQGDFLHQRTLHDVLSSSKSWHQRIKLTWSNLPQINKIARG
jgi:hypothetical protein